MGLAAVLAQKRQPAEPAPQILGERLGLSPAGGTRAVVDSGHRTTRVSGEPYIGWQVRPPMSGWQVKPAQHSALDVQ